MRSIPSSRVVRSLALVAALFLPTIGRPAVSGSTGEVWVALEPGLELAEFDLRAGEDRDEGAVRVLRIDPARYSLRLLNASAPDQGNPHTAREWSKRENLLAAVNASMYGEDLATSVSLMKTRSHTNNGRVSKDLSVLAFDPLDSGLPEVQIIDRSCQDFESLRSRYGTLVQSIRMVSCTGANVWTPQARRSSLAAIGMDGRGRVLFIHSTALLSTHDQIERLLALPIDLKRCMYGEGGSETQLVVRAGGREYEFVGGSPAGVGLTDEPARVPRVPNVIGVVRRSPK